MENKRAIATLTIGDQYVSSWKQDCEANWREYGRKHGYDIICLDQMLDKSGRAGERSPSWQKCLILSQPFARNYERIVWVDSDILINTRTAPSILDGVPIDKVGAAKMFCYTGAAGQEALTRMFDFWEPAIVNPTSKEYYTKYGFSDGFDTVVQAGVLVLSPAHHRSLLEKVYFEYEEKGGPEWHYEMRPLSYELLKAGAVHWIDPRFNSVWLDDVFLHYPFVLNPPHTNGFIGRFVSKIASRLGACSATTVRRACINATFLNSYFLHFGSSAMADMRLLDTAVTSWRQCRV